MCGFIVLLHLHCFPPGKVRLLSVLFQDLGNSKILIPDITLISHPNYRGGGGGMVSTMVYGDDDLDDADCSLGLAVGEVLDVVCCGLLTVCVLVPAIAVDSLMFSSTVEAFGE